MKAGVCMYVCVCLLFTWYIILISILIFPIASFDGPATDSSLNVRAVGPAFGHPGSMARGAFLTQIWSNYITTILWASSESPTYAGGPKAVPSVLCWGGWNGGPINRSTYFFLLNHIIHILKGSLDSGTYLKVESWQSLCHIFYKSINKYLLQFFVCKYCVLSRIHLSMSK